MLLIFNVRLFISDESEGAGDSETSTRKEKDDKSVDCPLAAVMREEGFPILKEEVTHLFPHFRPGKVRMFFFVYLFVCFSLYFVSFITYITLY